MKKKKLSFTKVTADVRSGLYSLGCNKSRKCPKWGSPGPPTIYDHWVMLPPTITKLFTVKLIKVTRPSYCVRVLSYFEALWYSHLYFGRKSNI